MREPGAQRRIGRGGDSLSQESPAHPASLRDVLDVLDALQDCGMRFADVRAVARWL